MLCFRKFPVAKSFSIRGRGKYQDFLSKSFCRTVSKNAVEEPFNLSLNSCIEKIRMRELGECGGGVSRFSVQIVLSQSAEKFRGVTLLCCVSEKF